MINESFFCCCCSLFFSYFLFSPQPCVMTKRPHSITPFVKTFQSQTILRELQQTCRATKQPSAAAPVSCGRAEHVHSGRLSAKAPRQVLALRGGGRLARATSISCKLLFINGGKSDKARVVRPTLMTCFASLTHFARRLHCGLTAACRLSQWWLAVTVLKERVADLSQPLSPFFLSTCARVPCHCNAGSRA